MGAATHPAAPAGSLEIHVAGSVDELSPLADLRLTEALFDCLPDVVFFVKNLCGEYVLVNETLVLRCGFKAKKQLLGRTPQQVFPAPLGESFALQDRQVLEGQVLRDRLELHVYPDGGHGWCVTCKLPLRNSAGQTVGLAGISRDVQRPDERRADYRPIANALAHVQRRPGEALTARDLAGVARMPLRRFQRVVQRIFRFTPGQLLMKMRIDAATRLLLDTDASLADIAQDCGYCDQSAFTRRFAAVVGMSPGRFRQLARPRSQR
jgi:AraC-like DNA-binding protein